MDASFWADKRPAGIPNDIDLTQYSSIIDVFDQACVKHAKLAAFSNMGVTLTYADLDRLSAAFASYLQQHTDLEPGDRRGVASPLGKRRTQVVRRVECANHHLIAFDLGRSITPLILSLHVFDYILSYFLSLLTPTH